MKARMHIELKCGSCNGQLTYHKDDFIKCNTLKCELRGELFHGPSIELQPVVDKAAEEAEAKKAATTAKRQATMAANKAAKEAIDGEADGDPSAEG